MFGLGEQPRYVRRPAGASAPKCEAGVRGGVIDTPANSGGVEGIRVDKSVSLYLMGYAEGVQLKGDYRDHSNRNRKRIFLPRT